MQQASALLSIYAARMLLVYLVGQIVPGGTVYADATFIAALYILYSTVDLLAASASMERSVPLMLTFSVSSAWCAIISVEQLFCLDALLGLDDYANPLLEAIIVLVMIKELHACWRSKQQSRCLR